MLPVTQRFIAESETKDRISIMTADAVSGSISGAFDAVVMCNIIQVLSEDQARSAIKNAINAIQPGGDLYILGRVLDDSHLSPSSALNSNLFFLNVFDGGQAYTERQHREWIAEAGFDSIRRDQLPDGRSVIVAGKPL